MYHPLDMAKKLSEAETALRMFGPEAVKQSYPDVEVVQQTPTFYTLAIKGVKRMKETTRHVDRRDVFEIPISSPLLD